MKCSVCSKLENKEYFIFETDYWVVLLRENQAYLGRCDVISKRHVNSLGELTKEEVNDFYELVKKLEQGLKKAFLPKLFHWNCFMNNFFRKERSKNPHVHWHLRPRYDKEIIFEGERFVDEKFAERPTPEKEHKLKEELMKKIITKIKESTST